MFEDFDDELDFTRECDEDSQYGCDEYETCADCPHLNFCDGCGRFMEPAPSPRPAKKEQERGSRQPTTEKTAESRRKSTAMIAIGLGVVAVVVVAYLLLYFI